MMYPLGTIIVFEMAIHPTVFEIFKFGPTGERYGHPYSHAASLAQNDNTNESILKLI